jgi:hypothetical protein
LKELGIEETTVVNDNSPQTVEQMILSHLNSQEYSSAMTKYETIKNIQNEHNNLVLEFINNYKQKLKQLLKVGNDKDGENKIETLLQFILYKIYHAKNIQEIDLESIIEYKPYVVEADSLPDYTLHNPFPKDKDKIFEFINKDFKEIKNYLNIFKINFKNMSTNISDFKKQLKPIIDTSTTIGLKGKCFIEKRLSIFYFIKKLFDVY